MTADRPPAQANRPRGAKPGGSPSEKTPETRVFRGLIREASFKGELSDIVMMQEASSGVKMKLAWPA
jgi:hypothetical protein